MDGNNAKLSIKAGREGIIVDIPEAMSANDICCQLYKRFTEKAGAFQTAGKVYLLFKSRGKPLTEGEKNHIIAFLNGIDLLQVSFCRADEHCDSGSGLLPAVCEYQSDSEFTYRPVNQPEKPYVFQGSLLRKQTLEIKGNVIILGDVSRDAAVISGKSIIVIGELAGTAVAGRLMYPESFILATSMTPQRLEIGRAACTFADSRRDSLPLTAIATNDNNTINITYI